MKTNEELSRPAAGVPGSAGIGRAIPHITAHSGGPLMIDIELIDEDQAQPRGRNNPGFRPESIAELAASYGPKGPKTPLSLRISPDSPGRYIINHGHRRYRAGKVKGLSALPAFIDNDYDDADQVIETGYVSRLFRLYCMARTCSGTPLVTSAAPLAVTRHSQRATKEFCPVAKCLHQSAFLQSRSASVPPPLVVGGRAAANDSVIWLLKPRNPRLRRIS